MSSNKLNNNELESIPTHKMQQEPKYVKKMEPSFPHRQLSPKRVGIRLCGKCYKHQNCLVKTPKQKEKKR